MYTQHQRYHTGKVPKVCIHALIVPIFRSCVYYIWYYNCVHIVVDCSCHIGGPFKHQPNGWHGYQVDASDRYFGAISVKFSDVIAEFDAASDLFSIFGIRRLRTKFRVSMYTILPPSQKALSSKEPFCDRY